MLYKKLFWPHLETLWRRAKFLLSFFSIENFCWHLLVWIAKFFNLCSTYFQTKFQAVDMYLEKNGIRRIDYLGILHVFNFVWQDGFKSSNILDFEFFGDMLFKITQACKQSSFSSHNKMTNQRLKHEYMTYVYMQ